MRPITQEFHWSLGDFSVVQGIASITVAIVSPFLGYLTDRWGARAIMLPGILAFGIANFLLSLLNGSLTELYVFWFLIGLSAAFVGPVAYSKVISAWFFRRRGLALGVSLGVGGGVCGALMPLVVGPIALAHGWRGVGGADRAARPLSLRRDQGPDGRGGDRSGDGVTRRRIKNSYKQIGAE
jgi:MFS family permease